MTLYTCINLDLNTLYSKELIDVFIMRGYSYQYNMSLIDGNCRPFTSVGCPQALEHIMSRPTYKSL